MAQTGVIQATPVDKTPVEASVSRIRLITLIGLIAAWECIALLGSIGILYNDVVPSAWKIAVAIYGELVSAAFYRDLGITFAEHIVGFIVGSAIAV